MKSNDSDKGTETSLVARWLLQDFFFRKILVVDLQWFRDIAVAQMNDRWPPEQGSGLFVPTAKDKSEGSELATNEAGPSSKGTCIWTRKFSVWQWNDQIPSLRIKIWSTRTFRISASIASK